MTPTESAAMTTDQLRDWCAEDDGWLPPAKTNPLGPWSKVETRGGFEVVRFGPHPYPPTRDGAAAALPEGWTWGRGLSLPVEGQSRMRWLAWAWSPYRDLETPDTGDEISDRFRLAVLCRIAEKEATNGKA